MGNSFIIFGTRAPVSFFKREKSQWRVLFTLVGYFVEARGRVFD